ncbi:hypothetical protein [Hungatella effluvii]|jgi:hypothetical protein|uniref:hypothetical protein n=1 Tax=Hungatella effluvii TaxID=1096246 RepID=UPI002A817E2D|nr:hypothetical protein [Hungatella effluvii]
MRWKKLIVIGVPVIMLVLVALILFIFSSIPSEIITFEELKNYAEENGYEFMDTQDEIPIDEIGKTGAVFVKEDVTIEYIECISNNVAKALNKNFTIYAQEYKEKDSFETEINLPEYGSYTLETTKMYIHITRIKNTIMHVMVKKSEKKVAKEIMKELGYMN